MRDTGSRLWLAVLLPIDFVVSWLAGRELKAMGDAGLWIVVALLVAALVLLCVSRIAARKALS